jgi:hypothetical protein
VSPSGRLIALASVLLLMLTAGSARASARSRHGSTGRGGSIRVRHRSTARGASAARPRSHGAAVAPVVGSTPTSPPIPPGFLGLSLEFYAVHKYTGDDPNAVNPVLVQLIRNLTPGQAPVLRIGGDSTDQSWWPVPGVLPPRGIDYPLTPEWMRTTSALAQTLGAKLIVGVNLMLDRPALAAVEARALLAGLGNSVEALEPGNESDLYATLPWYLTTAGKPVYGRPRLYTVPQLLQEFSNVVHALPAAPIAGPTFANLPWLSAGLGGFLASEPQVRVVTFHRYPLRGCNTPPTSPSYPSEANLLSDAAQSGLAQGVAPYVTIAHAQGVPFRIDEMNSVACAGRQGVSDTFASALWMLDTLFELANVGVDGVNVHTLPGAHYQLFAFTHTNGTWTAAVQPEYYGMLMFAEAAPPGSRLLPISGVADGPLKVWATLAQDGTMRIVLINEDPANAQSVVLQPPGGGAPATAVQLTAPSETATSGVSLGGQSFGDSTGSGVLTGQLQTTTVSPALGLYSVTVPPGSATMLTLP